MYTYNKNKIKQNKSNQIESNQIKSNRKESVVRSPPVYQGKNRPEAALVLGLWISFEPI
jgi:hypothetical protein